jgi:hypothetical protein
MEEIIFNWKFPAVDCYLEKNGLKDVVFRIHWRYEGRKGIHNTEFYGHTDLNSPSEENFILLDNITAELLKTWTSNILGSTRIEEMQTELSIELNNLTTTLKVTKLINL